MDNNLIHAWKDKNEKNLFEIMLWYSCNANCFFCSNEPRLRAMDKNAIASRTREILKQIYEASQEGYQILGLTGGEPTIYPDILKILEFAKKMKFRTIRIQTNAMRLADYNFCQRVIGAGANFIKFSIHGHKAALHDKLTQVPGSYDMVMRAFANLERMEVATETNFLINRWNYRFVPQFIAAMHKHEKSRFVIIFPMYEGKMAQEADVIGIRLSEAAPYVIEAIQLVRDLDIDKIIVMNMPRCFLAGYEKYAADRRPFNIKVSTPSGTSDSFGEEATEYRKKTQRCNLCVYKDGCMGLWKNYLDQYGDEEVKPILNNCQNL